MRNSQHLSIVHRSLRRRNWPHRLALMVLMLIDDLTRAGLLEEVTGQPANRVYLVRSITDAVYGSRHGPVYGSEAPLCASVSLSGIRTNRSSGDSVTAIAVSANIGTSLSSAITCNRPPYFATSSMSNR